MEEKLIGRIIVIDGTDGCGKATQARMLQQYISSNRQKSVVIDFPRYTQNFFGEHIGRALKGEFGNFLETSPYIISLVYALDRLETKPLIKLYLEEGYVVIFDRYTTANMIHQAAKLVSKKEQDNLVSWLEKMEYEILEIPRPDTVIFLDVPTSVSQKLLVKSTNEAKHLHRKKTDVDLHESNIEFQTRSRKTGLRVAKKFGWNVIKCTTRGKMKKKEDILNHIIRVSNL